MKKTLLLFITALLSISFTANAQWATQASGFATAKRGITNFSIVDAMTIWAAAYDGSGGNAAVQEFTKTTNGGATWTPGTITGATGTSSSGVFALDVNTAWAIQYNVTGTNGGVYKTTDGGATWVKQSDTTMFKGPDAWPNLIHFWDANNGVVLGDPNDGYFEIYTTTNGGTTWKRVPQTDTPTPLVKEYGLNNQTYSVQGDKIWTISSAGRVIMTVDKGMTWTAAATGFKQLAKIEFKNALQGLAMFGDSLKESIDGGLTWLNLTHTGKVLGNDLVFVPGTLGTFISTGATANNLGSSYSINNGLSWIRLDSSVQRTTCNFLNSTTGWSGGFNTSATVGGIFKWTGNFSGIADNSTLHSIKLFPNPSSGIFTFQVNGVASNADVKIKIYDAIGNLVLAQNDKTTNSLYKKTINLSTFAKGIYIVEVKEGGNIFRNKLVVQ
jgi:photosystem II stability/assembly factor-like uncharacterized protein